MTTGTTSPIEALRAAAKGKTFDEKRARSEIETAIGRYRAEYRATDAELEPLRQVLALPHIACRKPVAEGKAHMAKMRRHIAKLRKDVVALLSLEHRNTLFVVGGLYEEKKWSNDFGMMTVAGELRELIRTLDHIDNRIQAFTSERLRSSSKIKMVEMNFTFEDTSDFQNAKMHERSLIRKEERWRCD